MTTFATILARINVTGRRRPGAVTPEVCAVWREGGQAERIVEAVLALESVLGRLVRLDDEALVRGRRRQMDAATEAERARRMGSAA